MIKRFTDHAANERTYLAWIRTSVAIMAFGFLIEKFELLARSFGKMPDAKTVIHASHAAELTGLGIFIVGTLIIVAATIRYFVHKKAIETDELLAYSEKFSNFILFSIIVLLTLFIILYLAYSNTT